MRRPSIVVHSSSYVLDEIILVVSFIVTGQGHWYVPNIHHPYFLVPNNWQLPDIVKNIEMYES